VAVMRGASGAERGACGAVGGTVTFEQAAPLGDVTVTYDLTGVLPGEHGFHVHQFGDDSVSTGALDTMGQHFISFCVPEPGESAPECSSVHGFPPSAARQNGDMGNLTAQGDCTVKGSAVFGQQKLSLSESVRSIVGRAVLLHVGADKGTQPFGDAGGVYAYGVVGAAAGAQQAVGPSSPTEFYSSAHCSFIPAGELRVAGRLAVEPSLNGSVVLSANLTGFASAGPHLLQLMEQGDLAGLSSSGGGKGLGAALPLPAPLAALPLLVSDASGAAALLFSSPPAAVMRSVAVLFGRTIVVRATASPDSAILGAAVCGLASPNMVPVVVRATSGASGGRPVATLAAFMLLQLLAISCL
jgi:Cu-Zn family superoxide dismutase